MFVIHASIDDSESFTVQGYESGQLTSELVAQLIHSLDGCRHTLLTLLGGGDHHMIIGGDARSGLIVYATEGNEIFHNLLSESTHDERAITLVAGGQPGDYSAKHVVPVEMAVGAAGEYLNTGALSSSLNWETQ